MKNEKALVKYNNSKISKFLNQVKNLFGKLVSKEDVVGNTVVDDVEVLRQILDGKVDVKNLDNATKERLIGICCKRENEVREKIENLKVENQRMRNLLDKIA